MEEETLEAGLMPDQVDEVTTIDNQTLPVAEAETTYEDPAPITEELGKGITSVVTDEPMANELEGEFVRPAMEAEMEYQQQFRTWQRDSDKKLHDTLQDWNNFEPEEDEEVREMKFVRSLLTLDGSSEPVDAFDCDVKSALYAKKHFQADIETPRELFQLAKGRSDRRKVAEEKDADMQAEALLGTMDGRHFGDWSAKQGDISEAKHYSDNLKYSEYQKQAREQYGTEITAVKNLFNVLKKDGGQAMLEYAYEQKLNMSDEEYVVFKSLFRDVILSNQDKSKEDFINKAFGTDVEALRKFGNVIGRRAQNVQRIVDSSVDMFNFPVQHLEQLAVGGGAVEAYPLPFGGGFQMTAPKGLDERRDSTMVIKRRQAILNDLRQTLRQDYAPIELNFERGGGGFWGGVNDKLAFIEENAYGMPSAMTSMVAYATP